MSKDSKKTDAEVTTEVEVPKTARRNMLGSGALAAATAMFGLVAAACSDDDNDDDDDNGSGDSGTKPDSGKPDAGGASDADPDVEQLNALLTAEYMAIAAYDAGAKIIQDPPEEDDPLAVVKEVILQVAVDIQAQHKLHAAALVDAINDLDGTPVDEADTKADFKAPKALTDYPTIANVLKFAASAERGAAVSYNKVIQGLEAAKYRFLASSIEGDESQHFIVLTALVLGLASPGPQIAEKADDVFERAFVYTVGDKDDQEGLDTLDKYFP